MAATGTGRTRMPPILAQLLTTRRAAASLFEYGDLWDTRQANGGFGPGRRIRGPAAPRRPARAGAGSMTAETSVDTLIVGAGLSGIGAACRLSTHTRRTYLVLEAR